MKRKVSSILADILQNCILIQKSASGPHGPLVLVSNKVYEKYCGIRALHTDG